MENCVDSTPRQWQHHSVCTTLCSPVFFNIDYLHVCSSSLHTNPSHCAGLLTFFLPNDGSYWSTLLQLVLVQPCRSMLIKVMLDWHWSMCSFFLTPKEPNRSFSLLILGSCHVFKKRNYTFLNEQIILSRRGGAEIYSPDSVPSIVHFTKSSKPRAPWSAWLKWETRNVWLKACKPCKSFRAVLSRQLIEWNIWI